MRGCVQFAAAGRGIVLLVGDPEAVERELSQYENADKLPIRVVPSEGVIQEGEQPALALRQKPKASVLVATGLVKRGMADACVSMGSTGATMAAAAVILGLAKGVERPALGGPVVGVAPQTCILDLGANVDCRPAQMLSFGAIGAVFARSFWGIENPRVALLSVGAEAGKGNRQVSETTEIFESSGLNFIGNIEANDVPKRAAEVVVCDGFVGNIVMKLTEGPRTGTPLPPPRRPARQGSPNTTWTTCSKTSTTSATSWKPGAAAPCSESTASASSDTARLAPSPSSAPSKPPSSPWTPSSSPR